MYIWAKEEEEEEGGDGVCVCVCVSPHCLYIYNPKEKLKLNS